MGSYLPLNILFVVPYAPTHIRTRPLNLIKTLASAGHRITLATLWSNEEELQAIQSLNGDLESLITEKMPIARSIWNCIRALPERRPVQAFYSWSPRLAERIAQTVQSRDFDILHVEHLRGAKYALLLNGNERMQSRKPPRLVWDSVDCISDLFRRASRHSHTFRARCAAGFELGRTQKFEGWLATQFDRILVTSDSDRQGFIRLAEKRNHKYGPESIGTIRKRISVLPNGVDLDYFSPSNEARELQTLVITGKMSYHANVTAVVRFVKDIMPGIWAEMPQTCLWIVGRDPSPEIRKLGTSTFNGEMGEFGESEIQESRIHITGTVRDIRPFLRKATVAVAPIRYGVGIQNKVLEAMACGTPLVATREAVGDIGASPGQDLLVAKNEQELVQSILALLKDRELRSRLSCAGRTFTEMNYDWHAIAQELTQIYESAGY